MTADAVGGVWQYATDLARALAGEGVSVLLALLGPPLSADQRRTAEELRGVTLIETGLPLDWLCDGPAPVLAAGARIAELARAEGVDLLHLNSPALAAAAPSGLPTVAVAHGCVSTWWQAARPGQPLAPEFTWHAALMREGLHAADVVAAPTMAYARTVRRQYGLRRTPAAVHNGRLPLVATEVMPTEVFTAGRLWDAVKRTALLDGVAALLPVPFDAAGTLTAPHGETVAPLHLRASGAVSETVLAAHLAARPVFVSAAGFEPFGLAVLEAAAAGCPLVLSDIAGFRELWDGAAVFVAGDDPRRWADAIEAVRTDPAERHRLSAAAVERAVRYTPAAMADATLRLYAEALDARGSQGRADLGQAA
ncbi:glycosyltransferase family 4 protein [Sphingomonas aracearum]|nr:glycosyltransferase family 4 protein [Sphingomonas aracearum]